MSEIDWNEAPKEATHHSIPCHVFCNKYGFWSKHNGKFQPVDLDIDLDVYSARPQKWQPPHIESDTPAAVRDLSELLHLFYEMDFSFDETAQKLIDMGYGK